MATFNMEDLAKDPSWRRIFEQAAEQAKRDLEAWEAWFPREHTCQTREDYDRDVESAQKRLVDGDYPPTGFGEWLMEEDLKLVAAATEEPK